MNQAPARKNYSEFLILTGFVTLLSLGTCFFKIGVVAGTAVGVVVLALGTTSLIQVVRQRHKGMVLSILVMLYASSFLFLHLFTHFFFETQFTDEVRKFLGHVSNGEWTRAHEMLDQDSPHRATSERQSRFRRWAEETRKEMGAPREIEILLFDKQFAPKMDQEEDLVRATFHFTVVAEKKFHMVVTFVRRKETREYRIWEFSIRSPEDGG